nr:putative disease resistance protein [Quercus suber]
MLAEVFLGAVLQVLFDRLAPRELMSLVFRESVKKKLEKWRQTLSAIQMVLKDAEEKQLTDADVKQWLEAIRDLAYDLEDLFDDFAIEAMQRKLKAESESSSPASMVRSLVPTRFTPSAVKFNLKMKFEIEKISKRLKEITEKKDRLGLKDGGMSVKIWKRPSSTSVPYGPVIGRDEDRKKIIELILKDEQTDDANFHVISIVGISYFRLETKLEGNERIKVSSKARHFSFVGSRYDGANKFEAISEFKHLRTFLPLMAPYVGYSYLSYHIINQLLPGLQNLRVLSLSGYRIVYLPDTIGDLKHLRYLDLSRTQLKSLPASVSTLYNLQTLLLENCSSLKFLPPDFGKLFNLRHLNIFGSNLLEGMPLSIGNLTRLQTLSNFVVGKADSLCVIRELGPLVHLRGTLCISKLENVTKAQEARDSYLYGKQDLNEVVMEWSSNLNESQDEQTQLEVLNMLQPNVKLKELTVKCYGGTKFPTWIGDPSFSNLVLLRFENCDKCNSLPPVGQLPFLKDLLIKGMAGVKSVGREFYGESCSRPFQSLETLHFENMPRWEKWIPFGVNEAFACLRKLSIIRCHNLVRKLPDHLPSLKKLVIHGCWNLVVSVSNLPMLCVLAIEGCKRVECESSVGFGSPYSMVFSKISEFGHVTAGLMHGVSKVEYLKIVDSEKLTTLWEKIPEGLHRLKFLRELSIEDCPTLVSFPASGFPSMLKVIQIKSCSGLKSLLPEGTLHSRENACLVRLCVVRCDSMKSIARGQLPTTLKRLEISHCMNLQCALDEGEGSSSSSVMHDEDINNRSKTHLQYLDIKSCPSLTTLTSSGKLPATLTHLLLRECPKLMCLSSTGKLPAALQYLEIQSIPKLQKIAERLHQNTFLECIKIWNCHGLKSLPEDLHNLSKLRQFQIVWCTSFSSFPAAGLPSNLRVLGIKNCKNLKALPNVTTDSFTTQLNR